MRYPLNNIYVTNPFGFKGGTKWYSFHNGVDLRARTGTKVYAPESGVARPIQSVAGGYGTELKTKTGTHIFWHLSVWGVLGKVREGDEIALTGSTGKWTTGSHLHWGLKINGVWRDPIKYIERNESVWKEKYEKLKVIADKRQRLVNRLNNRVKARDKAIGVLESALEAQRAIVSDLKSKLDKCTTQLAKVAKKPSEEEIVKNWFKKLFKRR